MSSLFFKLSFKVPIEISRSSQPPPAFRDADRHGPRLLRQPPTAFCEMPRESTNQQIPCTCHDFAPSTSTRTHNQHAGRAMPHTCHVKPPDAPNEIHWQTQLTCPELGGCFVFLFFTIEGPGLLGHSRVDPDNACICSDSSASIWRRCSKYSKSVVFGRGFVLGRKMRIVLGRERLIVLVLCFACIRDHRNGISGEKGRRS